MGSCPILAEGARFMSELIKGLLTGPAGQRQPVLLVFRSEGMELIFTSREHGGSVQRPAAKAGR
jgi:hypothetical protein